jgi:pyrroline-5-carboxylate reductase
MKIAFLGGGNMATALIGGLRRGGLEGASIVVVEPEAAARTRLTRDFGVRAFGASDASLRDAERVVWAVKPQAFREAAAPVAAHTRGALHVSVMAGIRSDAMVQALGTERIVRAMPNTPALIGAGAAAISPGAHATEDDLKWAEEILGAVGVVVRVPEKALDAVTGLSGSGPAYVFLVAEALAEAGVLAGLPRDVAETLAFQTLLGSARLLVESDSGPAALRAAVTSPGGTTAAGLRELERHGVRAAFLDAVTAAAERSRELGG